MAEYLFIEEIGEQPRALRESLQAEADHLRQIARQLSGRIERVVLVGCGDPYFVSWGAALPFESLAGLLAIPVEGLEFRLHRSWLADEHTLLIAISASGKTIQVVESARLARGRGSPVLAVTNSPGSPVTEEADFTVITRAGPSYSFPTKTTLAALAVLTALAVELAAVRGRIGTDERERLWAELSATLPDMVEEMLGTEAQMEALAERFGEGERFIFVGSGAGFAAALIGAAKICETCRTLAEAHLLEEYAHLHIFSIRPGVPVFFLAHSFPLVTRGVQVAAYAVQCGGEVVGLAPRASGDRWAELGAEFIGLPAASELLVPMAAMVPLQLFAYHLSQVKGLNPDRPQGFDNVVLQKMIYTDLLEGWWEENAG